MARGCGAIVILFTPDTQLQGDHRAVSPILCQDTSCSDDMIDTLDTLTLAQLLPGRIRVLIPPKCQCTSVVIHLIGQANLQFRKRVFILGPSHNVYLNGCALSKCTEYATPLGVLPLDRSSTPIFSVSPPVLPSLFAAIDELKKTGQFSEMDLDTDEDEHSIEMHLPYVRKIFEGYVTAFQIQVLVNHETTPPDQERNHRRPGPRWSHRQEERGRIRSRPRAVPRERRYILRRL
jgi:hypothetical protein